MTASQYADRGYKPRACSFDLDDDGIHGEPFDDCRICDGVTADPDGDGVAEDLIYVDTESGNDSTGAGSPNKPYRTIQFAWDTADGPADGAEDIICFRGVATEANGLADEITPRVSGVPGHKVRTPSGSEAHDFEYPTNPTMLVGWDFDQDGCYPPFDNGSKDVARCGTTADVAVLDGSGLKGAFRVNDKVPISYLEMAHFEARNFGFQTASTENIGFLAFGRAGDNVSTHLYIHDLLLKNINRKKGKLSSAHTFNFSIGKLRLRHVAIENLASLNTGAYFVRGEFDINPGGDSGPIRFQKISYTAMGCDYGVDPCGDHGYHTTVTGFKPWGMVDGIELLDSEFDANTENWNPRRNGPVNGLIANACTRNWVVRNNLFRNWRVALLVKGSDRFCGLRPTDEVVIEANEVIVDDVQYDKGVTGVSVGGDGDISPNNSVEDVTIINNTFRAKTKWSHYVLFTNGNNGAPDEAEIVLAGNTFWGHGISSGWGLIEISNNKDLSFPTQHYIIQNNIVAGLRPDRDRLALKLGYLPSGLRLNFNTYDTDSKFEDWFGSEYDSLIDWRASSGLDSSSRNCSPVFVNQQARDFHLRSNDTCARDRGTDISRFTALDIDGHDRPFGSGWDIGADEQGPLFAGDFETGNTDGWKSVP